MLTTGIACDKLTKMSLGVHRVCLQFSSDMAAIGSRHCLTLGPCTSVTAHSMPLFPLLSRVRQELCQPVCGVMLCV